MSDQSQTSTFEQLISASPAQLYRAFTNSSALREWLCDVATTSPRVNGRIYLAWNDGYYTGGEFTQLEADKQIAFTWSGKGDPGKTAVTVSLTPENKKTRVTVQHSLIGTGDLWQETAAALEKAWPYSLENLASVMSTGEDLRFTQRPMLGIIVGDLDKEIAAQLGVPVSEGIRLDSLVDGMDAKTAGLQPNDVIVRIGNRTTADWASLNTALQMHRAGETVNVDYYRSGEKQTVAMKLSGRPIPKIPKTAVSLAETIRKIYDKNEAELENFFTEVTDAEASYKPAPDAWSAKETLAHLIHGERGWHVWIDGVVGGHEAWYDDWGGNIPARVAATVKAYPTTRVLLDELKHLNAETVALVANLPAEFMARKGSYWRLAYQLVNEPYHHQTHMTQMREAIEKARTLG
ncbi:MAG: SRPBCC domain-containing protein [Anaerolineales bacterium]|nr:SRPBCC domain-containing protein [Anaerolineales bacterium]